MPLSKKTKQIIGILVIPVLLVACYGAFHVYLAWAVSKQTVAAFDDLRESVKISSTDLAEENQKTTDEILKQVEKEQPNEISFTDLQDQIVERKDSMMRLLGGYVEDLEKIGKKDPQTGVLSNMKEREENKTYWLGPEPAPDSRGTGKARELKDQLDNYVAWANATMELLDPSPEAETFGPISAHIPPGTTWEYHTFHNKPVVADLAMLEKYKLDISVIDYELMNQLRSARFSPSYQY